MPDTPFRTPDEWRRAREAACIAHVNANAHPARSFGECFDRLYPCPPEPDRAEDERDYLTLCLGEANASKEAAHGEVARIRAERDALTPLARSKLRDIESYVALMCEETDQMMPTVQQVTMVFGLTPEQIEAARAVLGKEGT